MSKFPEDYFTATEARALYESLTNQIALIAEPLNTICEDVAILKTDVSEIKTRLVTVEDAVRISIPDIYKRISALEARAH